MDKAYMRSLPRETADDTLMDMARTNPKMSWLFKATDHGGLIELTAFNAQQLRDGRASASYRFFFSDDDFITQDLHTNKTKWLTGKAANILMYAWYSSYWNGSRREKAGRHADLVFCDNESREVMERRFRPEREGMTVWDALYNWQVHVQEKKLDERHERELLHTNEMMELVPDLPDDFDSWIDGYAMRDKRFLIYAAGPESGKRWGYCTHCGQAMTLDPKKVMLRMNAKGICPDCESPVTMRPYGRLPHREKHEKYAAVIQRALDGRILIRYFYISYIFCRQTLPVMVRKERYVSEVVREFVDPGGDRQNSESFEHSIYKQKGMPRWCPDIGTFHCRDAVLYTSGLREILAGTEYRYSGLEKYQEHEGCNPIPVRGYIWEYPKKKELEGMVKAGLTSLVTEVVDNPWIWKGIDLKESGLLQDLAGLTKEHRRILREINGGQAVIAVLQEFERRRIAANADVIRDYLGTFGANSKLIRDLAVNGIKVGRFTRYTQKQMKAMRKQLLPWAAGCNPAYSLQSGPRDARQKNAEKTKDFLHDWKDYIGWCLDLGYDMRDEYVLMPPDFRKAHDRLLEEEKRRKDEAIRKKQERINRKVDLVLKELRGMDPLHMQTKKLMIVIPSSAEDLKKEGQALHHCVSTYTERVAEGKTTILFVRKTAHPEEPYFTMEWKDGKVAQCRGMHNCAMPPDVKNFVAAFEKKMIEADGRMEQRQRIQVR